MSCLKEKDELPYQCPRYLYNLLSKWQRTKFEKRANTYSLLALCVRIFNRRTLVPLHDRSLSDTTIRHFATLQVPDLSYLDCLRPWHYDHLQDTSSVALYLRGIGAVALIGVCTLPCSQRILLILLR